MVPAGLEQQAGSSPARRGPELGLGPRPETGGRDAGGGVRDGGDANDRPMPIQESVLARGR